MEKIKQLCLAGLLAFCLAIGIASIVSAVTYNVGYFYQENETGVGYGNVLSSPLRPSTDKETFINAILSNLNSSTGKPYNDNRNRVGAAFIIQTMRGGDDHDKPDRSDIDDWKARIRNPDVTIEVDPSYWHDYTSGYTGDLSKGASGRSDDAYYTWTNIKPALLFKINNEVKAAILIDCGNPFDEIGLPTDGWSITPTASVQSTAIVGEMIRWTFTVTNKGPVETDKTVHYGHVPTNSAGNATGSPSNSGYKNDQWKPGSAYTRTYHSDYYTVKSRDVGKTICKEALAHPGMAGGGMDDYVFSEPACVTISSFISGGCRPIMIAAPLHKDDDGDPVSIRVYAKNIDDPSIDDVALGSYSGGGQINIKLITSKCTTGDRWEIWQDIDNHVEYYTDTDDDEIPHYENPGEEFYKLIGPCFDYRLNAGIVSLKYPRLEPGAEINVTPILTNQTYTGTSSDKILLDFYKEYKTFTKSKQTDWQITKLVYGPESEVPSMATNQTSESGPCDFYPNDGCEVYKSGSAVFDKENNNPKILSGDEPYVSSTDQIDDLLAGTKVCYVFSVKANASDPTYYSSKPDSNWDHSPLAREENCVIVVKKPKVQVTGGDLVVGRTSGGSGSGSTESMVYTTISDKGNLYGSWGEYGIFATGSITGMASGSAFANSLGFAYKQICSYSTLTFHNAGTGVCETNSIKGYYKQARNVADVAASFMGGSEIPPTTSSIEPRDYFSESGLSIGHKSSNLTLTESKLAAGKKIDATHYLPGQSVVLKVDGNVFISGDQIYEDASYTGISQLPQLVIIATGDITISSNVSRVDAWLVSGKAIRTCDIPQAEYEELTVSKCNKPLTINGPVMANKLYLLRTAGSGPGDQSGDPAEIFNLRADAYLWSFARASTSGRVQTVYTTELPPRF